MNDMNYSLNSLKTENCGQNMVGRKGFEPSNPAMSRQLDDAFWERYKDYLSTTTNKETRNDRISMQKNIILYFIPGNASELLTLSNDKRIHAMKSISSLSKYLGCYDIWKQIIEKYQLKWSTENSLETFNSIWNNKTNYSSMLCWIKQAYVKLPIQYWNILLHCTLTGLRPDEGCKSIELIHNDIDNYLNKETMTLEHFKYPQVFFRRTKKAYISVATRDIIEIANIPDFMITIQ